MQEFEVLVPRQLAFKDVVLSFEAKCLGLGLAIQSGTLKKYPGSVHWHLTKPGEKGTLEATLWKERLWLSVHENRRADWQSAVIDKLRQI